MADTFTRADSASTLGSAETGQPWTAVTGTWGISTNQAYTVTDTDTDGAVLEVASPDYILTCTISGDYTAGNARTPKILCRYLNTLYWLYVEFYGGNVQLVKNDNGSWAALASAAQTMVDGNAYTLTIVARGNNMEVLVDGTLKFSHTLSGGDVQYAAYTKVGMFLGKNGSPSVAARWDNFRVVRK